VQGTLSAEDTLAIHEVMARYTHITDGIVDDPETSLAQLHLVFAKDVVWGGHGSAPAIHGLDAVASRYAEMVDWPRRHHFVQTPIVTSVDSGRVRTRTHFMAVWYDGSASSGDYLDVLARTDDGWRIVERRIVSVDTRANRPDRLGPPGARELPEVYAGWEIV
jgi:hypothetical protein